MAATQITLVIDRQNRVLIQYNASVAQIPSLSQCDQIPFLIQIADPPINSVNGLPTILTSSDIQAGKPRLTISQKATGTLANQPANVLAYLYESGWTWDGTQSGFTGVLNLNTLQLQNFFNGQESCEAEFEVRFSTGGTLNTILPGPANQVTILANDDVGSIPPVDILNGVTLIYAPMQIKFAATGNLYAVSEDGSGHLSFDLVP
jgi:hypothetical protein